MKAQVKHMCKGAWHNIHSIGKIRQYLTQDQTKTVVYAHVISKLDNNSLLTVCNMCADGFNLLRMLLQSW